VTDLLRWGSPGMPDGQALWRSARDGLAWTGRHGNAVALTAAAIGVAALVFLTVGYVRYERLAAEQAAAVRRAESANADLQDALARLRDRLGATNQTLGMTQGRIAALSDEAHRQLAVSEQSATWKADRIERLTQALDQAKRELHLAEAQRVTLMARLSKSEADTIDGQARRRRAQAGVEQWQQKVQQLTADRDKAAAERDQLRTRVMQLEQKLSLRLQQAPRPVANAAPQRAVLSPQRAPVPAVAAAAPAPSVAVPAPAVALRAVPPAAATARAEPAPAAAAVAVAAVNHGALAHVERVLASAGVDVERLFADFGVKPGLGGPFVPMPRGGLPGSHFSAAKLAALPGVARSLPLLPPMLNYRETSPFGERSDPFNGRRAFHPGIDLAAPYGTPVYATAPGVVTYAGYRSDYGKIVEINHGHGIVSRYGHLARYTVLVGERVEAHTQIGYEGSTGRSTGPHLIYEIDVNGEPQDPAKFLGLARLVRVAEH
jgi:murein DD-endopeptidase MepM/ murein hydrolase activator NlpD